MRISVSRLILGTLLIGFFFLCSTGAFAEVLHVSTDGDGSNGLSWETAFTSISEAMVEAASGAIWVEEGVYAEQVVFNEGVSLFGGFSGTETLAEFVRRDPQNHPTVIDGEFLQPSDQKGRNIFDFTHTTVIGNRDTRVDGFTILGGFGGCIRAAGDGGDAISTWGFQVAQCMIMFGNPSPV